MNQKDGVAPVITMRFLDGILENPMNIFNPASYGNVDPKAGSNGAARGAAPNVPQIPGVPGLSGMIGGALQSAGDLARGFSQEGLGGMLDPQGMMDRQRAQRELAQQFNIVPDGTPGIRQENQVSEAQFREIARTYSDIRMGRSDLQINLPANMDPKDAEAYRQGTMRDIGRILQTETGRDLIGQLSHNTDEHGNHRVTSIAGNDADPQNAHAAPGNNSSSTVTYNPGSTWVPQPGARNGETWMPMRSDVQLFHELTHSMHQTHGTSQSGTVTKQDLDNAGVPANDPSRRDIGNVDREEQATVGIGAFRNAEISENSYRRARQTIAGLKGPGIVGGSGGDVGMQERNTYGEYGLGAPIRRHNH